jgi:hypothetical protein
MFRASPATDGSRLLQRANVVLLLLNVIGAIEYVVRASSSWRIPQEYEHGVYALTGEPFIWAAAVLPTVALFLLVNLTWGALILGYGQWRSGWFFLTVPIWLVAIAIDFAHH